MPHFTVYTLKIKIASIHFKIWAINDFIQFQLFLGHKLLDMKQIQINQGLMVDSATLQCEISDKDLQSNNHVRNDHIQMEIVLIQKHNSHQEKLGSILISFQEFQNIKMRKFHIEKCFDSSAYLEAFLLLLPTRRMQEETVNNNERLTTQDLQINLQRVLSGSSIVDIKVEEDQLEEQHQPQTEQPQMNEKDNEDVYMTFNMSERLKTVSVSGSQMPDLDSLITLNQILNQTNTQLTLQNRKLKEQIGDIKAKLAKISENHASRQSMENSLKNKIIELELRIRQKDTELKKKNDQIERLQVQNQKHKKEIAELRTTVKSEIKEELRIDNILLELGKYSETANKYRSKAAPQLRSTQLKLTPIPKFPIVTVTKQKIFKEAPKSSRSVRQTAKRTTIGKEKEIFKHDETVDTMKEVNSAVIPK